LSIKLERRRQAADARQAEARDSQNSGRAPLVVAIEAAGFRDLHDMPVVGPLRRPRCWAVRGERAVATPAVAMLDVVAEEPQPVPFVEDDDLVLPRAFGRVVRTRGRDPE